MVALPNFDLDPTLEAMKSIMEKRGSEEPRRKYMGASSVGEECERRLYYQYNGFSREPIEFKGLCAIQDGHRTEELMIERLRLVPGIELYDRDENGNQFGFMEDGFGGHCDGKICGLIQSPRTPHILEIKCCNVKKFEELNKLKQKFGEKNALKEWDFTYYVQAQIYMKKFKMMRHYLVVATPGGRDVTSARTEYNAAIADAMENKARRVMDAKEPPVRISTKKEVFICKFCPYRDECWKDEKSI